eukprot:137713-Rhodomonas_salina.1
MDCPVLTSPMLLPGRQGAHTVPDCIVLSPFCALTGTDAAYGATRPNGVLYAGYEGLDGTAASEIKVGSGASESTVGVYHEGECWPELEGECWPELPTHPRAPSDGWGGGV